MLSANYEILIKPEQMQRYITIGKFLSNKSNVIEGKINLRYKSMGFFYTIGELVPCFRAAAKV